MKKKEFWRDSNEGPVLGMAVTCLNSRSEAGSVQALHARSRHRDIRTRSGSSTSNSARQAPRVLQRADLLREPRQACHSGSAGQGRRHQSFCRANRKRSCWETTAWWPGT